MKKNFSRKFRLIHFQTFQFRHNLLTEPFCRFNTSKIQILTQSVKRFVSFRKLFENFVDRFLPCKQLVQQFLRIGGILKDLFYGRAVFPLQFINGMNTLLRFFQLVFIKGDTVRTGTQICRNVFKQIRNFIDPR